MTITVQANKTPRGATSKRFHPPGGSLPINREALERGSTLHRPQELTAKALIGPAEGSAEVVKWEQQHRVCVECAVSYKQGNMGIFPESHSAQRCSKYEK